VRVWYERPGEVDEAGLCERTAAYAYTANAVACRAMQDSDVSRPVNAFESGGKIREEMPSRRTVLMPMFVTPEKKVSATHAHLTSRTAATSKRNAAPRQRRVLVKGERSMVENSGGGSRRLRGGDGSIKMQQGKVGHAIL